MNRETKIKSLTKKTACNIYITDMLIKFYPLFISKDFFSGERQHFEF